MKYYLIGLCIGMVIAGVAAMWMGVRSLRGLGGDFGLAMDYAEVDDEQR